MREGGSGFRAVLAIVACAVCVVALHASTVVAASPLAVVYALRPDLQRAFSEDGTPRPLSGAGFLMNLEDWARQYGWQSYPELADYAPKVTPPRMLKENAVTTSATHYVIVDTASGAILAAKDADAAWPIASITKLMTTTVALDEGIDVGGVGDVETTDEVGGARLHVTSGTTFTVRDLLAATLVGSANNAANALARLTGLEKTAFVEKMNDTAATLGLTHTAFVDPTGIELGNTSNAREVAALAAHAFSQEHIRAFAGAAKTHIAALSDASYVRDIQSTNWLLFDHAYDDLYVTAGKTGFLNESGWNLAVEMHPMGEDETRSLTIVVLGAAGRRESFDDAAALARATWKDFVWE